MSTSMEAFIPISMFVSVAAVVIVALYLKLEKRKIESAEILAAIEKGVEVKFPDANRNRLLTGLIWLLTGLVMTLALGVMIPENAPAGIWIWGLVPAVVGVAYITVYRIDKQKGDSEEN